VYAAWHGGKSRARCVAGVVQGQAGRERNIHILLTSVFPL
jgi:hypothetical protein